MVHLMVPNMTKLVLLACAFALVQGHGSMNIPLPRNNDGLQPIDTAPGASSGPSCLGDACGWFAAGCFVGCPVCSNASSGAEVPSYPSMDPSTSGGNCEPLTPTLPDKYRTYNAAGKSSNGDWTATHPWRAPGRAPMGDSCGNSGAYYVGPGVPGYEPLYPGSKIPRTSNNVEQIDWKRGEIVEAGWSLWSNHGGGYQYRLCPLEDDSFPEINEDCFTAHPVPFADKSTVIRSPYGKFDDFSIPAMDVTEGVYPEGAAWRMNPIPACNCDKGYNCTNTDDQTVYTAYEAGKGDGVCEFGYQFEPSWPTGYGYWGSLAHWTKEEDSLMWTMVDKLRIPKSLKPGPYLMQWRWDAESSSQVWGNCADINIL